MFLQPYTSDIILLYNLDRLGDMMISALALLPEVDVRLGLENLKKSGWCPLELFNYSSILKLCTLGMKGYNLSFHFHMECGPPDSWGGEHIWINIGEGWNYRFSGLVGNPHPII